MAQSIPAQPAALLTPTAFLQRYLLRFRNNDEFKITEADLQQQATDLADLFQLWSQVGKTLLFETVAELALATPDQRTLVVNQLARVAATRQEFVLQPDSNGPLWAFASAKTTSTRVRVRWLPIGDPLTQLDLFPVLELTNHPYAAGDVVQHTFPSGQTIPLQIRRALPLPGAGITNPTPTGLASDPNYLPFAPLVSSIYSLPVASPTVRGGFRVGAGLAMTGDVLSVVPGAGNPGTSTPGAFGSYVEDSFVWTEANPTTTLPAGAARLDYLFDAAGVNIIPPNRQLNFTTTPATLTVSGGALEGETLYYRVQLGGTVTPPIEPGGDGNPVAPTVTSNF